jgi:hypothetical protein
VGFQDEAEESGVQGLDGVAVEAGGQGALAVLGPPEAEDGRQQEPGAGTLTLQSPTSTWVRGPEVSRESM